ncbi:MAG TPA: prepilin-type N-terminal cleavage/methylation domain-containing protein [Terriglobales bacterium]
MSHRRMRGFTLIEAMIVVSIILLASAIFFVNMRPAFQQARLNNAYNTVLATMRRARETAVAERRVYIVTFVAPRTMTITQAATGVVTNTFTMPLDVTFDAEPGIPNTAANTPDHFGTGGIAIDFDQGVTLGTKNRIYFQPDGSGQDVNNNINNGVLYVARTGDVFSSRAITLWGATGRIRGWRLYTIAGVKTWRQQ